MGKFIEYLIEESTNDRSENYIFDFQVVKRKLFNKLDNIIDIVDDGYDVPSRSSIEFITIIQNIKELVVEHLDEGDEFGEMLKLDIKTMIKLMYPDANVIEFIRLINREIIDKIIEVGIVKLDQDLNKTDMTMDAKDEFGKLLSFIYDRIMKKDEKLSQNNLNDIKMWINKIKNTGNSVQSLVKNSDRLKFRLYDNIKVEEDFEEDFDKTV